MIGPTWWLLLALIRVLDGKIAILFESITELHLIHSRGYLVILNRKRMGKAVSLPGLMNPELHLKPSLPPRDYYLGIKTGYEQNGLPVGCLKYAFKNCLKECGIEPYPKKVQTKPPQRKEASHER